MARTISLPGFVLTLEQALRKKLRNAEIDIEKVGRTNRYRFLIVSDRFRRMDHPRRQNLVWDVADKLLAPAELLRVSMIVTMAPDAVNGQ